QIQHLIRRVFLPGWPKPSRQVVFTQCDQPDKGAAVCARVAQAMTALLPGRVCAVDADICNQNLESLLIGESADGQRREIVELTLEGGKPTNNLWVLPSAAFVNHEGSAGALRLQSRMSELRRQFDYVVLHAPGGESNLTGLLGQFADGVILIVQANVTRRAAAVRIKQHLQTANARLLGVILAGREFPIPEQIYRRV